MFFMVSVFLQLGIEFVSSVYEDFTPVSILYLQWSLEGINRFYHQPGGLIILPGIGDLVGRGEYYRVKGIGRMYQRVAPVEVCFRWIRLLYL